MEQKKIANWESIFTMMINYWFEVNGIDQKVLHVIKHPEQVEIKTSTRMHFYKYEDAKVALYEWRPINHLGVEALDILKYAIFEDQMAVQTLPPEMGLPQIITSFKDAGLKLIEQNAILNQEHRETHQRIKNKLQNMLDKLDSGQTGPHFYKDAQVLSQMTNDVINMETQELKDLALFQKSLETAKPFIDPKSDPKQLE